MEWDYSDEYVHCVNSERHMMFLIYDSSAIDFHFLCYAEENNACTFVVMYY